VKHSRLAAIGVSFVLLGSMAACGPSPVTGKVSTTQDADCNFIVTMKNLKAGDNAYTVKENGNVVMSGTLHGKGDTKSFKIRPKGAKTMDLVVDHEEGATYNEYLHAGLTNSKACAK
jgi:hypothetical protein